MAIKTIAIKAVMISEAIKGLPNAVFKTGLWPTQLAAELTAAPILMDIVNRNSDDLPISKKHVFMTKN